MANHTDVLNGKADIVQISNILHKNLNTIQYLKTYCISKKFDVSLLEADTKEYNKYLKRLNNIHGKLCMIYQNTTNA